MRIIAKVVWTKPVQPPKPSLHFKPPSSRETHTDGSEPSRNLHLTISKQTQKEVAIEDNIKLTRLHYIIKRYREKLALVKRLPAIG